MEACRRAGLTRDRGVYRLRRLTEGFGRPVVRARRGGLGHGHSTLTPFGRSLLSRSLRAAPPSRKANRLAGSFQAGLPARIRVAGGAELIVAFRAREGERVHVSFEPEAILLARHRFPSSARNVLAASVRGFRTSSPEELEVVLAVGALRVRAAITPAAR
ncbi:MAG: hypothetical protein L3K07_06055, partial [Thermoplasmata archaeon]|nr:hypothetical protein [Thermoplasmata archaeon]